MNISKKSRCHHRHFLSLSVSQANFQATFKPQIVSVQQKSLVQLVSPFLLLYIYSYLYPKPKKNPRTLFRPPKRMLQSKKSCPPPQVLRFYFIFQIQKSPSFQASFPNQHRSESLILTLPNWKPKLCFSHVSTTLVRGKPKPAPSKCFPPPHFRPQVVSF